MASFGAAIEGAVSFVVGSSAVLPATPIPLPVVASDAAAVIFCVVAGAPLTTKFEGPAEVVSLLTTADGPLFGTEGVAADVAIPPPEIAVVAAGLIASPLV